MFIEWFKTLWFKEAQRAPLMLRAQSLPSTLVVDREVVQGYPLDDTGQVLETPEALVARHQDSLIRRLRLDSAMDADRFQTRMLTPIRNLAHYINAIPGSASEAFAIPGGLFGACLETAFFAFQASGGSIFTAENSVQDRHKLEPRWRYLCFLAGLVYPLGIPLVRVSVLSSQGRSWPKHELALTDWMSTQDGARVYLTWPEPKDAKAVCMGPSSMGAGLVARLAGQVNMQWLEEGSNILPKALYDIACGIKPIEGGAAYSVVDKVWRQVLDREQAASPRSYGKLRQGSHPAPYFVEAMRQLAQSHWHINQIPLVVDTLGVYLVWPDAGEDIVSWGAGRAGWPESPALIADLLLRDRVFERAHSNDLGIHQLTDPQGIVHQGYKLSLPLGILPELDLAKQKGMWRVGAAVPTPVVATQPKPQPKTPLLVPVQPEFPQTDLFNQQPQADGTETPSASDDPDKEWPIVEPALSPKESDQEGAPSQDPPAADPVLASSPRLVEPPTAPRYSDLIPQDMVDLLNSRLHVECLGKLVHLWNQREEPSESMVMTPEGPAFALALLKSEMRDPPDFILKISSAGLIYTRPSNPGKKMQKVQFDGSKTIDAIILSSYASKKLGLNTSIPLKE